MKNKFSLSLIPLFLLVSASAFAETNIQLYFKGTPEKNTKELPKAFEEVCAGGVCGPTTQFNVVNPKTDEPAGTLYVWGKDYSFSPDGTLCFTEMIEFALKDGTIYTVGNKGGTCGAPLDSGMVEATSHQDAVVIAGGGAGTIVGGTERYKTLKGTYNDRVFVEFLDGNIHYYDGLFFNIMPAKDASPGEILPIKK